MIAAMTHQERRIVNRKIATEFVAEVNAATRCAECGEQPVEWHNDDHPSKPNARVSSLRTQGASVERIKAEMDRCTPLCRTCHMKADGRLDALRVAQPYKKGEVYVEPKPCLDCGKPAKPTRRGRCNHCYLVLIGHPRVAKRSAKDGTIA